MGKTIFILENDYYTSMYVCDVPIFFDPRLFTTSNTIYYVARVIRDICAEKSYVKRPYKRNTESILV